MKRYVWKSQIDGKWHSALHWSLADWKNTTHDTWEEAFAAAFTTARKELFNL